MTRRLTVRLMHAKRKKQALVSLSRDIKTLLQWLSHDVFEPAGPSLAIREELFDFIVSELRQRECKSYPKIRALRKVLENQQDQLLAFAGVLDHKLIKIANHFKISLSAVRDVCLLYRKQTTSNAYWAHWNRLHSQLSDEFYDLMRAVSQVLKQNPRASSLVENLNSRLRNHFVLRRRLDDAYLNLLQLFLNHRRFLRSQVSERVGKRKSPLELMTGQSHPHWAKVVGLQALPGSLSVDLIETDEPIVKDSQTSVESVTSKALFLNHVPFLNHPDITIAKVMRIRTCCYSHLTVNFRLANKAELCSAHLQHCPTEPYLPETVVKGFAISEPHDPVCKSGDFWFVGDHNDSDAALV